LPAKIVLLCNISSCSLICYKKKTPTERKNRGNRETGIRGGREHTERRQYEVCYYYSALEGKIFAKYSLLSITNHRKKTLFFTLILVSNKIHHPIGFFSSFNLACYCTAPPFHGSYHLYQGDLMFSIFVFGALCVSVTKPEVGLPYISKFPFAICSEHFLPCFIMEHLVFCRLCFHIQYFLEWTNQLQNFKSYFEPYKILNVVAVIQCTGFKTNDTYRARFSSVTEKDVVKALDNLVRPNKDEAMAVDARQEIDLKVGVAFTRFQTGYFQGKYGNLDSRVISLVFCSVFHFLLCLLCYAIFLICYISFVKNDWLWFLTVSNDIVQSMQRISLT